MVPMIELTDLLLIIAPILLYCVLSYSSIRGLYHKAREEVDSLLEVIQKYSG